MRIYSQLTFGRHIGLTLNEVPHAYLEWLYRQYWMCEPRWRRLREEIHKCLVEVHHFPPDWESSNYDDDDECIRWDRKYD